MDREVLDAVGQHIQCTLHTWQPVSGGDISNTYVLEGESERVFCKTNSTAGSHKMFRAEANGLRAISNTGVLKTPRVLLCETIGSAAVLVLEYIEAKVPSPSEMATLGAQLARLHTLPQESFGWPTDNYIGSLPQSNSPRHTWGSFYLHERLLPQLHLAVKNGLLARGDIPGPERMQRVLQDFFEGVNPSLLHGDLWSGNYLIAADGIPYLIDPAVYLGHSEVDLAMSSLFGGFPPAFYDSYHELVPQEAGHQERRELYQLYYLLVHLNLFGKSYYSSVNQLMQRYFGR